LPSSSTPPPSTSLKFHADRMRSFVSSFQHHQANSSPSAFVAFRISNWANTCAHLARAFDFRAPSTRRSSGCQIPVAPLATLRILIARWVASSADPRHIGPLGIWPEQRIGTG
jgi:hypothetical protein